MVYSKLWYTVNYGIQYTMVYSKLWYTVIKITWFPTLGTNYNENYCFLQIVSNSSKDAPYQ